MKKKMVSILLALVLLFTSAPVIAASSDGVIEENGEPRFVSVSAGFYYSYALKDDGSLYAWGGKEYGSYRWKREGAVGNSLTPVKIMDGVKEVSDGIALKNDGSVWALQNVYKSKRNDGKIMEYSDLIVEPCLAPVKIMDGVKTINAGFARSPIVFKWDIDLFDAKFYFAVKDDDSLWAWGYNEQGLLGDGGLGGVFLPAPKKIMDNVKTAGAGYTNGYALKTDGSLWMWGQSNTGLIIGYGSYDPDNIAFISTPKKVMDGIKTADMGRDRCLIVKNDGSFWAWGEFYSSSRKVWFPLPPTKIMDDVKMISTAGSDVFYAIKNDDSLWISKYSCVSIDDILNVLYEPVMDDVKAVDKGEGFELIIKNDNSVWSGGYNFCGNIGNGTVDDSAAFKWRFAKIIDSDGTNRYPIQTQTQTIIITAPDESKTKVNKADGRIIKETVPDYKFVMDENAVGEWEVHDFIKIFDIDGYNPSLIYPYDNGLPYEANSFYKDGTAKLRYEGFEMNFRWSKGFMIWSWIDRVPTYEIRSIDSELYMFIPWENNDYTVAGYYVFKKV
jgi:alpha-tubulin suppressor-like RCC1 family protein